MILHRGETRPAVRLGGVKHLRELPREHRGSAEVTCFAGAHDRVQRFERFLDRRLRVEAMDLIEIDVIDIEPAQAVIDRVHDMLARKSALIRIVSEWIKNFRGDHEFVAGRSEILQGAAEHFFTRA